MGDLDGKIAIVTGASRGIGRATAERLATAGATVVVNYGTSEADARAVVEGIRERGGTAVAIQADIAKPPDIRRLFEQTLAQFDRLDVLVANAGYAVFKPLLQTTEEDFDRIYALNAKGTYFCLQEALRRMADGGRIVCISTIGTLLNLPGGSCYFGSKAAVEQFCRVAAKEVARRGITVNVVSPGFVETQMLTDLLADLDPDVPAQLHAMTPLTRFGRPDDIAEAVMFLVGPGASWITRQNVAVDGGIVSR